MLDTPVPKELSLVSCYGGSSKLPVKTFLHASDTKQAPTRVFFRMKERTAEEGSV